MSDDYVSVNQNGQGRLETLRGLAGAVPNTPRRPQTDEERCAGVRSGAVHSRRRCSLPRLEPLVARMHQFQGLQSATTNVAGRSAFNDLSVRGYENYWR